MSYQVLAKKWRPQKLSDVIGQQHIITALSNSLSSGRLHYSYLFSGTRGVGKTSLARLLSKGMNCEIGITPFPCCKCKNCIEIEQGRFIDLIEIDAASRSKVEDIREVLENIQYSPVRSRFKIYLIDEVHMLSRHSFNALLKTLEEPPKHIKFLLATTDHKKIPITVISRCIHFNLKSLESSLIRDKLFYILKKENIEADINALQLLSLAAKGSMRDALSLTEHAIALDEKISVDIVNKMLDTLNKNQQPLEIIKALVNTDCNLIMKIISQCASNNINWDNLLIEILSLLHRIAMEQLCPEQFDNDEEEKIQLCIYNLAKHISPSNIQLYYKIFLVGRKELPYAPSNRIGVEMTLLRALGVLTFNPSKEKNINLEMTKTNRTDIDTMKKNSILDNKKFKYDNNNNYLKTKFKISKKCNFSFIHDESKINDNNIILKKFLEKSDIDNDEYHYYDLKKKQNKIINIIKNNYDQKLLSVNNISNISKVSTCSKVMNYTDYTKINEKKNIINITQQSLTMSQNNTYSNYEINSELLEARSELLQFRKILKNKLKLSKK